MITELLLKEITDGRNGTNQGFSTGLTKLDDIIDGVTKNTSTLIFSTSGSGKTTFVLYSYIYRPLMESLEDDKFKVIYFSMEMNAELLLAKLLSIYIWETYKKQLSLKELLSRKKNYILSEEDYNLVLNSVDWLNKIEKKLIIYDKPVNAEIVYSFVMKHLEKDGQFYETEHSKKYTPKNKEQIVLVVLDHLSLCRPSKGRNLKEEIDLISSYLVTLRNISGISPVLIMQTNRSQSSMDRRKEGMTSLSLNDTKDSGGPVQDSEIVLSINNPFRDKLASYRGYDLKKLKSNFRSIEVLKSRYGEANIEVGCAFYGKIGIFKELPLPDEIYDYAKYETPEWCFPDNKDLDSKESDNKEQTDNNISYKFTL